MSLSWYIRRLANMSPPEIIHRFQEQIKRQVSRRSDAPETVFSSADGIPRWPELRQIIVGNVNELSRAAIRNSADRLLRGEFAALGVTWPRRSFDNLFPAELWRLDPVSGLLWPAADRFCYDIPYRHERARGDIKYVWEINRLQFLQPLAAAFAIFDDKAALAAVDKAIVSWARANPPFKGIGWNSGIELALRAVSIIVACALCGDALNSETKRIVPGLLAAHLFWIERYPSRFSSANNHRIAELMASFLMTTLMPDLPNAPAIALRARIGLEKEAGLQFHADGVPAEQSPTYGAFSAEMLLLSALAASTAGRPLASNKVETHLINFAHFIAALTDPDGRVPAIGDDDEGHVLSLCDIHESGYPVSVANAVAAFTKSPIALPAAPHVELRDVVFGERAEISAEPPSFATFPDGGYTRIRRTISERKVHLVMDHGPLGFLSIAAHGHADANALTLSLDGQPVLVDPGTYLYHSGGPWRDWFRGTRAHNTLTVAGMDQSRIGGPFNWSRHARAKLVAASDGDNWNICATHDGYLERLGVIHRRLVSSMPDGFTVTDTIEPAEPLEIEAVFQFADNISVEPYNGGYRAVVRNRGILHITFDPAGDVDYASGGDLGRGGWISSRFGNKTPAPRLTWKGKLSERALTTRIVVLPPR